jgi:hypothetical protein
MNPFNFGSVATGRWFIDREQELAQLKETMSSGGKVLLISPRRYGKTSLAYRLMNEFRRDPRMVSVYIDAITCTTLRQFTHKYAETLAKSIESKTERMISFFKEALPSLRPRFQVSSEGEVSLQLETQPTVSDEIAVFEKVLDLPEKAALKKNKKLVVILDEFQALSDLPGAQQKLLWMIRSKIQHHRHVGYLFAGSQKHALEQMAVPKDSPFFRMFTLLRLGKIPESLFAGFIHGLFRESGITVKELVLQHILERAENIPYYVLNLCHEVYEAAREHPKNVELRDVETCVSILVSRNRPQYEREWEGLSHLQKNVLRALSQGHNQLHSTRVMKEFELTSVGGVQKAVTFLVESQYMAKAGNAYAFEDIWFKEWIKLIH